MQRGSGKRVRGEFFTQMHPHSNIWTCKCGCKRKVSGHGYTNLVDHVQRDHAEDSQELLKGQSNISGSGASSSKRFNLFYHKKTVNVYGWTHFVVIGFQPFSIVENEIFRSHFKYDNISVETLGKYLGQLTKLVENKISRILPNKFVSY